jgi:ribosomal protein S6--L-glutamate ligase
MVSALRARGHDVFLIDPEGIAAEAGDRDWLDDLDLVVGRGRSLALLCLLAWAESAGTPTINRRAAIAAVHNKAEMAVRLAAAGVPAPKTFLGRQGELAATVPENSYPLILKPSFGDNCRGLEIVGRPAELAAVKWPEPLVLAQEFLPTDGNDLKLYVIGDEVWAVRKPSPLTGRKGPAELIALTPALEGLARRCGTLFGLELFGVDCLDGGTGTVVIEVNEFPNYTGVPGADDKLADYVLARTGAEGAR